MLINGRIYFIGFKERGLKKRKREKGDIAERHINFPCKKENQLPFVTFIKLNCKLIFYITFVDPTINKGAVGT